jgi:predicted deacetylase
MQTRALIVSLHDVSPLTWEKSVTILRDLAGAGVREVSLLVIPNHHNKAPIEGNTAFRDWLVACQSEGHEIVAHGYYHQRKQKPAESPLTRAITGCYTAGEGEFFDLSEDEAREVLQMGRRVFEWCGISPTGFIAPAWLLGEDALRAVRTEGFSYTTYLNRILPLYDGAVATQTQSLVWSVRAAWRRQVSLQWNQLLFTRMKTHPVLRIGIHPPDWDHPAIRKQVLALTRSALAGRTACTYERWLKVS